MKAKDAVRLSVMRGLKSDLKYKDIEIGRELTDEDCIVVFRSAAKRRKDAIDAFKKGGRSDRAGEEEAELAIIQEFLPTELSDGDLANVIDEVITEVGAEGPQDFGKVMKAAMVQMAGKAQGKEVNEIARRLLG